MLSEETAILYYSNANSLLLETSDLGSGSNAILGGW